MGLEFEPEADGGDSGVMMVEAVARALGPGDCPAGNGGETRARAWAPGAARLAGPGGRGAGWVLGGFPSGGRRAGCGLREPRETGSGEK